MRTVVGIDPGKTGGICRMETDDYGVIRVMWLGPMPVIPTGIGSKMEYDLKTIVDMFRSLPPNSFVLIERQQTMPAQGISSAGSLMRGFGMLEGICAALLIPYMLIGPQKWQKFCYDGVTGKGKTRSVIAAQRLFPCQNLLATMRSKEAHDGMADALLIAYYGVRGKNETLPKKQLKLCKKEGK